MEKFKYLGVTFSSDGRQYNELDTRIEKESAVMSQLYGSVVLKRELCTKAKLLVFRSVFVPILTYGHECWVMTKRLISRVQAVEMGFLQKFRGLSLFDKVKSNDIRLFRIERSQLRWYGYAMFSLKIIMMMKFRYQIVVQNRKTLEKVDMTGENCLYKYFPRHPNLVCKNSKSSNFF